MTANIKVLLVDDHTVVRAGFVRLLDNEVDLASVAEAESSDAALKHLRAEPVDVVVADINMPDVDGITLTSRIKKQYPDTKVAMLSIHEAEPFISKSFEAGADAYLSKRCAPEELATAIKKVHRGDNYISSDVARKIALGTLDDETKRLKSLTAREYEIFKMLASGKSIADIAERIHISPKTCYVHRTKILSKLELHSAVELSTLALRNNIV